MQLEPGIYHICVDCVYHADAYIYGAEFVPNPFDSQHENGLTG